MAIHLSHHDEIALITLDRPEALNALSFGQLHDLNRILDAIGGDKSRALLVTGAGDRAFSAGADIKELMGRSLVEVRKELLETAQQWGARHGQFLLEWMVGPVNASGVKAALNPPKSTVSPYRKSFTETASSQSGAS